MYNSMHNKVPKYLSDKFVLNSNLGLRSTTNEELVVPFPNMEFFRKSFSYSGASIWNEIPLHIRQAENINSFKRQFLQWKQNQ